MNIDVHAHLIADGMLETAGKYGPRYLDTPDGVVLEVGRYRSLPNRNLNKPDKPSILRDHATRLAEMDHLGVDHLVLSTSPLFYLYWAEPEIGARTCQAQNDALAAAAADPERFSWSATLPVQDVPQSITELRRALALGAKAVTLGTNDLGGKELDDEALWPLYAEIEAAQIPLQIHPHPLTMAGGGEDRYNLSWVVGYTYQETMAFARLVLGGVFDDFPRLKVVLPHGAGAVPYQLGRIEEARRSQSDSRARLPVEEYFKNVWFELLVHDVRGRRLLLEVVGTERVLVGSNFGGWDAADGFAMLDELGLSTTDRERIAWRNTADLFKLEHLEGVRTVRVGSS